MSRAVIGVFASQIANFVESYIGATLQDKPGYEWVSTSVTVLQNESIRFQLILY